MKTFDEIRGNSLTEATAGDHEEAAMAHDIAAKSVRQDLRAKKAHQRAAEHHNAAANHIEDGNHEKANASHVKAKNAAAAAKQYGNKHSANAHADTHAVKRVPSTVGEGYASAAQRKAIWAAKNDKKNEAKSADVKPEKYTDANGKTKVRMVPVVKENDANEATSPADLAKAMAAYKAKGGKVTKAPAAKAQGYHGKDDPGKDIAGIMDRPDTKKMGTRKKVKSMEATQVDEISKDTKKSYIKKAADDMSKQADRMARAQRGDGKMAKAVNKFVNRRKGIARAVENYQVQQYKDGKKVGSPKSFGGNLKKATTHASEMGGDHRVHKEAKRTVTIDRPDRLASMRVSKDKPPFDNAKPMQKDPKDRFGNSIKNRAKHLARKAARDLANKAKQ
jgi:hypothetical protein